MVDEPRVVSVVEHYDLLIEEGNDPFRDGPLLQRYMSRWDGPPFFGALGSVEGRDVFEIGVGTGRLARQVLDLGCRTFTGIDVSARTLDRAAENLCQYENLRLVLGDIEDYQFFECFDVAYSVLTFMHIERKRVALANIVGSLRPHGVLVLSISGEGEWLDFGSRRLRLHNAPIEDYIGWLTELGCHVDEPIDLVDGFASPNCGCGDGGRAVAADGARSAVGDLAAAGGETRPAVGHRVAAAGDTKWAVGDRAGAAGIGSSADVRLSVPKAKVATLLRAVKLGPQPAQLRRDALDMVIERLE